MEENKDAKEKNMHEEVKHSSEHHEAKHEHHEIKQEHHEKEVIEQRERKAIEFLKKSAWIYYLLLAIIVYIGIYIRTRNLSGLKDITTGGWTLGPDLDPFLFLRWAKYIVENGSLMIIDTMRNVPLGYATSSEMRLLSYLIAWFHNIINYFTETTVEYSAVIFPVFFFALTTIAFFLFVRKVFEDYGEKNTGNIIAIVASALFIVLPSLLSRTIAGIPEKESVGFLFMFLTFYFYISAWKSKNMSKTIAFAILSGLTTALMALIWGGFVFIMMTIGFSVLIAFILDKVKGKEVLIYALWIGSFFALANPFSARYSLINLLTSTSTMAAFATLFILVIDYLLFMEKSREFTRKIKMKIKLPDRIFSLVASVILVIILVSIAFGPTFVISQTRDVIEHLIHPFGMDRLTLTVAENRQPYFNGEWRGDFGPTVFASQNFSGIPLFFWLFFVGSIFLFYDMLKEMKSKDRMLLTASYTLFLFALIFSRFSPESILNGVSGLSKLVYFGGIIILGGCALYLYHRYYKEDRLEHLKNINFSYILLFVLFILTIVAARGGVRLIMVLAPVAAVIVAYFSVSICYRAKTKKDETTKIISWILIAIVILSTIYTFYNYYQVSVGSARGFMPSSYTQQWQKAMSWTRENTPKDAVFAHWWDYGYWIQSLGERATVTDGGNAQTYWNHLIGRYLLTGTSEKDALEFLYAHNATHFLIDSTDIGKYPAYASIGSDENYDRASWMPIIAMNEQATQETKNGTVYYYTGGIGLDEDISWETENGQMIFPAGTAGIGAIKLKIENNEVMQPEAVFVFKGQQYTIPMRYVYFKGKEYDFKSGLESGIFVVQRLTTATNGGVNGINDIGALIYLSRRTVNSNMARLYLFNETDRGFKLVHQENNLIIEQLRAQGQKVDDFVVYGDVLGPIKIWEIEYPKDIKFNPDYLETVFPDKQLSIAK